MRHKKVTTFFLFSLCSNFNLDLSLFFYRFTNKFADIFYYRFLIISLISELPLFTPFMWEEN